MQTNEWKIKFESLERMFRACHNVSQEENEELKDQAKGESA